MWICIFVSTCHTGTFRCDRTVGSYLPLPPLPSSVTTRKNWTPMHFESRRTDPTSCYIPSGVVCYSSYILDDDSSRSKPSTSSSFLSLSMSSSSSSSLSSSSSSNHDNPEPDQPQRSRLGGRNRVGGTWASVRRELPTSYSETGLIRDTLLLFCHPRYCGKQGCARMEQLLVLRVSCPTTNRLLQTNKDNWYPYAEPMTNGGCEGEETGIASSELQCGPFVGMAVWWETEQFVERCGGRWGLI